MKLSDRGWWKIYLIFFSVISFNKLIGVFLPTGVVYTYYHSLMAFHGRFDALYFMAVANNILNVLTLVPLFFLINRRYIFNNRFWQGFLVLRVITEFTGHNYEWQLLKSLYHADLFLLTVSVGLSAFFVLPSYLICFRFAFGRQLSFS